MTLDGKKPGLLILDGDAAHAKLITDKLLHHGVQASYTLSSDEAIERTRTADFNAVLAEIALPGRNGFEVARAIRGERVAGPEVILMSQDPGVTLFDCHQAGACYLIRKPVNIDELGLALKRFTPLNEVAVESKLDSSAALGRLYGQIRVSKNKQELPIEVSNLGRGGFFCKTDQSRTPPPVGQVVDFQLRLGMVPDCQCSGRGIIRWSHQPLLGEGGVGIEFLKVPDWFQQVAYSFADLFKVTSFIPNA